ncbi:hypothetical protein Q8F55_006530 [Vanrija albida]|uniref:Myb-like domain-containing protein n=1 Tax=Vanrija albida TaxID=181172 RepID=A0ABR3PXR6_9TREE
MPPKRSASTSPAAEPAPKKAPPAKAASKPKKVAVAKKPASSSPASAGATAAARPPRDKQAWTRAELRRLYETLQPRRVGVNWAEVTAAMPGRTVKSCQNKWARMQSKIIAAVEDLGE